MNRVPMNVTFVYSLLVIDLLVNIADNVVYTSYSSKNSDETKTVGTIAFAIFLTQIFCILTVIINLIRHFLNVADQVKLSSYLIVEGRSNNRIKTSDRPLPHRLALKLVLDKYWWSLLVGAIYLVLTIILHIVRLDSIWQTESRSESRRGLPRLSSLYGARLQDYNEAYERNQFSSEEPVTESISMQGTTSLVTQPAVQIPTTLLPPDSRDNHRSDLGTSKSLVPIVILLVHKLVSTCYYISFVVVYRLQVSQMVNRILGGQQIIEKLSVDDRTGNGRTRNVENNK